jgi:ADP-heptose:LPS heptosyltransferase
MKAKFDFELMQFIDHWLGVFLCSLIGIWEVLVKAVFWRKRPALPKKPRGILVLKWFGLGSIVQMRALVQALRKRYPDSRLIFVTFPANKALVRALFSIDELIIVRNSNPLLFLADTLKALLALSFKNIDIAVDLEFYSKYSTLFSYFSGARVRVGFYLPSFWRKHIITHPVYYNYFKHITDIYRMVGKVIDVPVGEAPCGRISVSGIDVEKAAEKLRKQGYNGSDRLIGVNVNAGELAHCRRWPKEYFIELVKGLSAFKGFTVVLIGSSSEKEYTDSVYHSLDKERRARVLNTAGLFNLPEFIAFLNSLFFLVTNDSGPLHFAVMQGVPTISIWGPQAPRLYGAKDKRKHKEFYIDMDCSPCMNIYRTKGGYFCNNQAPCLKGISPTEILEYAVNLIREKL